MREGIKLIAIAGSMLALMATGALAAANSDEGGGAKATKQSAPSGAMKGEGGGSTARGAKGQTAMKGNENLKSEKGNISGREGSTFSNARTSFSARTHGKGYAYSSGGNLSISSGHRRYSYRSSSPEVDIYRRHHRHYI